MRELASMSEVDIESKLRELIESYDEAIDGFPADGGTTAISDIEFLSISLESLMPFHGSIRIVAKTTKGTRIPYRMLNEWITLIVGRLQTQERIADQIAFFVDKFEVFERYAIVIQAFHTDSRLTINTVSGDESILNDERIVL